MKIMGNEITYLMPTKNFLIQPPDPCKHLTHRLSVRQFKMEWCQWCMCKGGWEWEGCGPFPHFWWQSGEMSHSVEFTFGGSMESLVEMVQIENSLQNYVNFTLRNGFSWAFKTLKPMSFQGPRPLDPRCHDGIADEKSTNWKFSAKLHVNFTLDLTL